MKQFILPSPPDSNGTIRLSGADYHYLARVRRLKAGAVFDARLPCGEEVRLAVQAVGSRSLRCAAEPRPRPPPAPQKDMPPVALFQALPKPSKMDIIVRQAAEGGIAEIAPFVSAYSPANARASGSGIDLKIARWGRIIKEARQQSGSAVSTVIRRPCSFQDLIRYWESRKSPGAAGILLHQTFLSSGGFHEYLAAPPDLVVLAIGPEGGFSPSEAGALLAAGFKPALLGAAALRVETAALYAAAAVRLILLERESWMWKNS